MLVKRIRPRPRPLRFIHSASTGIEIDVRHMVVAGACRLSVPARGEGGGVKKRKTYATPLDNVHES